MTMQVPYKAILKLLLFLLLPLGSAVAQKSILTVKDSLGTPLQNVSVRFVCSDNSCRGKTFRTVTDTKGKAANPFTVRTIVQLSSIGFKSLIDTLQSGESKTITLQTKKLLTEQVVVTGQLTPGSTDKSIHKVRVIDRERITSQAANTARDVLSNELNVRLSQDNILGSFMSLQGLSGQNVKILVDGVPVIGRQDGNIDLSQISLANVERLEIVQGPLATIYGTDALAGAVNFITKKPSSLDQKPEVSLHLYSESVGQYNADGRIGFSIEDIRCSVTVGRNFFGGFANPDTSRFKQWKPREQYFSDWSIGRAFGESTLRYTGTYFNELITNRGEPRAPYRETAFDDTYRTIRFNHTIFLEGSLFGNGWSTAGNISFNHFLRQKNTVFRNLVTLENTPTSISDQDTSQFDSWFIRGTASRSNIINNCNLQMGYDIALEKGEGRRINDGKQTINDFAIFGLMQYAFTDNFVVQPGVRLAYNTRYQAPVIPSVNIKYNPEENLSLRLSYSQGFRAPSLKELFMYFVDGNHNIQGNANLQAEFSHNVQASTDWKLSLSEHLAMKMEGSTFFNDIRNLISLAVISGTEYSYFNIDKFQTLGARTDISFYTNRLTTTFGVAYTGRYNQVESILSAPRFSFSPEMQVNCEYTIPDIEVKTAVFYKFTGRLPQFQQSATGELLEGYIESFHSLDFTMTKSFLDNLFSVSAGVKNIANVQNLGVFGGTASGGTHSTASSSTSYSYGRTFFLTVSMDLK